MSESDTWYWGKFRMFVSESWREAEEQEEEQSTQSKWGGKGVCVKELKSEGEGVHATAPCLLSVLCV